MTEQTLYEKYGGFSNVSKIVLAFYDTLLDDDDIGPFFDDVDMAKMVDHQTKFIASLLGGPASYTDNQLKQLHSHLEITDEHYDVLEHQKVLKSKSKSCSRSKLMLQCNVEVIQCFNAT